MMMINITIKRSGGLFLPGLLLLSQLFHACKKVDAHANLIEGQPYIVQSMDPFNFWNKKVYYYSASLLVDDTAMLVGKLFLDQPGTRILIGNVPVVLLAKGRIVATGMTDPRTGKPDSLDVCRFLITRDMAGNNLPFTVQANGYRIQGPPVTVLFLNPGNRRTDTTLVVDKLGAWLPADVTPFKYGSGLVNNTSVSGDGTIWFDNKNGYYKLFNGQVSPVLLKGASVTDKEGKQFTIDQVLSSVISRDGNTLFFSSIDKEAVDPAADSLYFTRLCSMNVPDGSVTTINRTTVKKGLATYVEDPGPYNGNIAVMKIAAGNLTVDINGNLYFTNYYFPETLANSPRGVKMNSTTQWYNPLAMGNFAQMIIGTMANFCRMDPAGQVSSLVSATPGGILGYSVLYRTPGPVLSDFNGLVMISPDGSQFCGMKAPVRGSFFDIWQYGTAEEDIENKVTYNISFIYKSWDTAAATRSQKYTTPDLLTANRGGQFYAYLTLPNNDILHAGFHCLTAYNLADHTAYTYAGVENWNDYTGPRTETGNAGMVDFTGGNTFRFCGMDRQGGIYYCTGGVFDNTIPASNDLTNGVRFYKLHQRGR